MLKRPEDRERSERRGGRGRKGTKGTPSLAAAGGHGAQGSRGGSAQPGRRSAWDGGEARRWRMVGPGPPALTHPVQKAQAVPQRRRGRHGAGHLPAPPLFRPGPRQSPRESDPADQLLA